MTYNAPDNLPPIHPGEFLADELQALGMSARKFAKHIDVPPNAVTQIMRGERNLSAEMAMRLGKAFDTTAEYWMGLQLAYDVKTARERAQGKIEAIRPLVATAA